MTNIPTETQILIVGAGPTGLTLAAELRRRSIEAVVLDKIAEGENTSRAAVVHARTLEMLEPLGVVPRLLEEGVKVPIFRVRDRDKTLITIDFSRIPSKYAMALMCPQNRTEGILLNRLRAMGGDVLRPVEMIGVNPAPGGCDVALSLAGQPRKISAAWVIGCDGMHSRVREAAAIPFRGAAYEESFVLADVGMDWPLSRDEVSLFFSSDGLVVVAPLPNDRYRLVATADGPPEQPSLPYLQALLDGRGPKLKPGRILDLVWTSRFRVHHRVATTFRDGRVLLCGDAAHVHSPAGGQGMNTGIQDAVTLAAALADVLRGADEASLDAWASRRHQIAADVVSLTDRATRMATLRSPIARTVRNFAIDLAGHVPAFNRALAARIAELGSD